jgi:hypothetical protein
MHAALHPWRAASAGHGRRFLAGLLISLSFALVAFEWRTTAGAAVPLPGDPLPPMDELEYPPVVILEKRAAAQPAAAKRSAGPIVPGPEPAPEPGPVPDPGPDPGPPDTGPIVPHPIGPAPPETVDPGPMPWDGVEQRPYFRSCLGRDRTALDDCTEELIERHLKRNFQVPDEMRREERTTVSIEIDAEGRIGRVLCVPKPSPAVQAEIERVIRALPPLMPATQNGRPVQVVFQLPFKVVRG